MSPEPEIPQARREWRNFTPPVIQPSEHRWNYHEGNPYGIQIAVVGMGTLNPTGRNVQEFVDNVISGKSFIERKGFPEYPWLPALMLGEIKDFDPYRDLQGKVLREHIKKYSRAQQIEIPPAFEALLQADLIEQYSRSMGMRGDIDLWRVNPQKVDLTRVAVIYGTGIGGSVRASIQAHQEIQPRTRPDGSVWGDQPNRNHVLEALPARGGPAISITFGTQGPMKSVLAECATGEEGLETGLDILRLDKADVVIVVNSESAMDPEGVTLFSTLGVVSKGASPDSLRAFDEENDGFAFTEAASAIVLEKLDHARARGADVLAILAGSASTSDAEDATLPREDGAMATLAMQRALKDAGGIPTDGQVYVNAHATGTKADAIEANVIRQGLGEHVERLAGMSSTKPTTGHMLGAATLGEFIIGVEAMRRGVLPPSINSRCPIPEVEGLRFIRNEAVEADEVVVFINNGFGFGGHNATGIAIHPSAFNYQGAF